MAVRKDVYAIVTDRLIKALEEGVVPWRRTWSFASPRNISNRRYRGINALILSMLGYEDPRWLTFNQAIQLGGAVKKGEKGVPVIFWKFSDEEDKPPFARYYTVFNVEQCQNLDLLPLAKPDRLPSADDILRSYHNQPKVQHGGDSAHYSPRLDIVAMPAMNQFESPQAYYATLFHEMVHSTGHQSRLARPSVAKFDHFASHQYSEEELVAEIGAAFLIHEAGLEFDLENSTAYISSWLKKLQDDRSLIVKAAGKAQRAVDHILGLQMQEEIAA